ncbi:hypothetical protein [uncultured Kordia sp.]|uniref:hypothetical protein n=1 Tax=uncultured Kordia sp. TaxID=507699 RepID=UPI002637B913|nr:hypothetical protein [uncultured Kordia sp.]
MSKLQIKYSKEIAKELGKIAVCLPGEQVKVGDIIKFPYGKTLFGKTRPMGTFKKITSLKKIGIKHDKPIFSNAPDTYYFTSRKAVEFNTKSKSNFNLQNDKLLKTDGTIHVEFSSEGAIYFLAIDCDKKELNDLLAIENAVNVKGKEMLWDDTYLVTSVTIAKKALILQSRSKSSGITIEGNISGISSGTLKTNASSKFHFKNQTGDVFIKNWSDDVTVFMDVVKFEKQVFESEGYRNAVEKAKIKFKKVKIDDLLINHTKEK